MSQWDKLIKKIISLSKDIRFSKLKKVLESYGYTMEQPRNGSSHCIFRKDGENPITIPKHKVVKVYYILLVKKVVLEEMEDYEIK